MTITPEGLPIWSRSASFTTYGGSLQKKDYGDIGSVNALTDVSAAQFCRFTSDAAAVARTAPLAVISLSRSGTTITVQSVIPLWADPAYVAYDGAAAPTGYPSAALTDTNEVTVTLPASAVDEFGVSQTITAHAVLPCSSGVSWDGVITAGAFALSGFTTGSTVALQVW